MPAVATQLLADENDLVQLGPLPAALGVLASPVKLANLRAASGEVLAAYGKRFGRTAGSSFTLATWGDLTKKLVVVIAAHYMLTDGPRGLNPASPDGEILAKSHAWATEVLNEIADITNANARIDPDAVGSPDGDDMGPLGAHEGGDRNEADFWTQRQFFGGIS